MDYCDKCGRIEGYWEDYCGGNCEIDAAKYKAMERLVVAVQRSVDANPHPGQALAHDVTEIRAALDAINTRKGEEEDE